MRLAQVRGAVLLAVGSDSAQGMAALERAVEGARTFEEPLYVACRRCFRTRNAPWHHLC